jgi:hypothetical protein
VKRGPRSTVTKDTRLQHAEKQQDLRRALKKKPDRRLPVLDRLLFWLSTSRKIDGLWVGSRESEPESGLRRVEDALRLIKHHDSLHYSRVLHNLERIWVDLLPNALACYDGSKKACVLDERFVLLETTTLEGIASAIVHEATHARLGRWGISYIDEKERSRIEAICLRRELSFVTKLPHSEQLQDELARTLEWVVSQHDYFSDLSFQQRDDQGNAEILRHLGTPDWIIRFVFAVAPKIRAAASKVRRLVERFVGPPRQA